MTSQSDIWERGAEWAAAQNDHHAETTGAETDPLAAAVADFEASGVNPFAVFLAQRTESRQLKESTRALYKRSFLDWHDHMDEMGRHPACPNKYHVLAFIDRLLDVGPYTEDGKPNSPDTVRGKLTKLVTWYGWMQSSPEYPHHGHGYNPFDEARSQRKARLTNDEKRTFPRIETEDLRNVLRDVSHVRDRAIIMLMVKCGLRAGEVINMELADVDLQNTDLMDHYESLGTHLRGRQNAVYIPHRDERDGNKAKRPRVIPLDRETRDALRTYLLIRPDADAEQVFLSVHGKPLCHSDINRDTWQPAFSGRFPENEDTRTLTSHFGRHFFSDFWDTKRSEVGFPLKYVQYLRGDEISATDLEDHSIDAYLSVYYEDIESLYREQIFQFGI